MRSRLSPFWRFQFVGWVVFVVASFPLKLDLMGSVPAALLLCLARDGSSFLLTLGLRSIYRTYWSDNFVAMAALIIAACTLGGLSQSAFFSIMRDFIPESGEILPTRWMEFSVFYERAGLLYAWSFLYFGVRHAIEGIQRRCELALLEIQMLRAQMNPHFLYNAFNTLLADAGESPEHLKQVIQAFAEYMRYSLENRNKDLIPLGREVDAIRNYLIVEKARFRGDLEIECQIDESTRNLLVPGIVIQPLIENAIKYGRKTSPKPLTIRLITSWHESHFLRIEVSNTGHWVEEEKRCLDGGVGLENLRRRLTLLYHGAHEFRILNKDGWVTIQADLPINS